MDAKQTKELIEIEISANTKKAVAGIQRFQKIATQQMQTAQKDTEKLGSATAKFHAQLKNTGKSNKYVQDLKVNYDALSSSIKKGEQQLAKLREGLKGSTGADRKNILATIKQVKQAQDFKGKKKALKEVGESIGDLEGKFDTKGLESAAADAGEELSSPLQDVLNRDAIAAFRKGSKILSGGLMLGARALSGSGSLMKGKGDSLLKTGTAGGKLAGAAMKAGGTGLEAIAGILTKLGPLISIASSFMMSFVKIMIDAESSVKDFNRQILSTSGSGSFLTRSFGNVDDASKKLEDSLRAVRDGSMSMANAQLGISKEVAGSFISSLTAEGVALDKLGGSAESVEGAIQDTVMQSRALGVSLSETTQLQGEMMSNMGYSLDKVKASFQDILDASEEAGIASNKFFGIIRSFSSDLSLFSLRMEDVTKIMKVLGKTMDPRNAQKFLQTVTQQFSGGLQDKLRATIIAGPSNVREMGGKDLADKIEGLRSSIVSELGNTPQANDAMIELVKIIKDPKRGPRAIEQWQAKQNKELSGAVMEAVQDAALMQTRLSSGNDIDTASVANQFSVFSKMAMMDMEAVRVTGKHLIDLTGENMLAMENANIASHDFIANLKKLNQGIIQVEEKMIKRVMDNAATDEDKAKLKKLGITGTGGKDVADALRKQLEGSGGVEKFWSIMSENEKGLLTKADAQIDYQKATAGFQVSIMDKLGAMADILLNQIYGVLVDIWNTITEAVAFLTKNDTYKLSQGKVAATRMKDPELQKVLGSATSMAQAQKGLGDIGTRLLGHVGEATRQYDEATAALKKEKSSATGDPNKVKALEDKISSLKSYVDFGQQFQRKDELIGGELPTVLENISKGKKAAALAGFNLDDVAPTPPPAVASVNLTPMSKGPVGFVPSLMPQNATGGGTQNVNVNLTMAPEAGRFIQAQVVDGVANFDRNRRKR